MNTTSHRFTVGDFCCMIVTDGVYHYPNPAQSLFGSASASEVAPVLRAHNIDPATWSEYISPYPSLLIETNERRLLIDMGAGSLGPKTGNLWSNLQQAGVVLADIDTVFITHAHPDHVGGALDKDGKPVLPNARYIIGQAEWNFWAADPDLLNLQIPDPIRQVIRACARTILPVLRPRVELVEAGAEIMPGIEVIAGPGHTPGQLGLAVRSNGEDLLVLTDVFLHPIHIEHPEWYSPFDYDPVATVATRRPLYARAAATNALVTAGHLPWPCLGHIRQDGAGWRWESI